VFWKIVNAAPAHLGPAYVTLEATGLRVGEFLRLTLADLRPANYGLRVRGTKTAGSDDAVVVGDAWWPLVKDAVPHRWATRGSAGIGIAPVQLCT